MIRSFADRETERLFDTGRSTKFRAVERVALSKLEMLEATVSVEALRVPPGNRLEALKGDRKGQFSIRVNDQFRVCFRWEDGAAWDVEIVDYHR